MKKIKESKWKYLESDSFYENRMKGKVEIEKLIIWMFNFLIICLISSYFIIPVTLHLIFNNTKLQKNL